MKGAAIAAAISMTTPIATQADSKNSVSVMIFSPGLCVREYVAQLFTSVKHYFA
jgi:hypothetical protein